MSSSRGSSQPRDGTQISNIAGELFMNNKRSVIQQIPKFQQLCARNLENIFSLMYKYMYFYGDVILQLYNKIFIPDFYNCIFNRYACLVDQLCLTAVHQVSLSIGFPRQEYWSRVPFPSPGIFPIQGLNLASPMPADRFFTTEPPGKPHLIVIVIIYTY